MSRGGSHTAKRGSRSGTHSSRSSSQNSSSQPIDWNDLVLQHQVATAASSIEGRSRSPTGPLYGRSSSPGYTPGPGPHSQSSFNTAQSLLHGTMEYEPNPVKHLHNTKQTIELMTGQSTSSTVSLPPPSTVNVDIDEVTTPAAPMQWPVRDAATLRPPPIILETTSTFSSGTIRTLSFGLKYHLHTVARHNSTELLTFNLDDFDQVKRKLAYLSDLEWHTYTPRARRQLRLVLRPVPLYLSTDAVAAAIQEAGLPRPVTVNRLPRKIINSEKKESWTPSLSVLVAFAPGTNLQTVQSCTSIANCLVQWEKPNQRPSRGSALCRRCGGTGHYKNNCKKTPRCLHCGAIHSEATACPSQPRCTACRQTGHLCTDMTTVTDSRGRPVPLPVCPRRRLQIQKASQKAAPTQAGPAEKRTTYAEKAKERPDDQHGASGKLQQRDQPRTRRQAAPTNTTARPLLSASRADAHLQEAVDLLYESPHLLHQSIEATEVISLLVAGRERILAAKNADEQVKLSLKLTALLFWGPRR